MKLILLTVAYIAISVVTHTMLWPLELAGVLLAIVVVSIMLRVMFALSGFGECDCGHCRHCHHP